MMVRGAALARLPKHVDVAQSVGINRLVALLLKERDAVQFAGGTALTDKPVEPWYEGHPMNPADPDCVPVRLVNGLAQIGTIGANFSLTLTTDRIGFDGVGGLQSDMVVAARLRMDLEMAIILRDALVRQIEIATQPRSEKAH